MRADSRTQAYVSGSLRWIGRSPGDDRSNQAPAAHKLTSSDGALDPPDTRIKGSTEPVDQRPVGAFLWRFFDCNDDEVTAGGFRSHVRRCEMSLLPTVGLLGQFPFRIVNVYGNLGPLDLGRHPEPILVSFEQLLAHSFFLAGPQIAAPVV